MNKLKILILSFLPILLLNACGVDRSGEYEVNKKNIEEVNKKLSDILKGEATTWIWNTLNEHYLWSDEMKTFEDSNPRAVVNKTFDAYNEYFQKLLSKKDGKHEDKPNPLYGPAPRKYYYSYLKEVPKSKARGVIDEENSYGLEYLMCDMTIKDKNGVIGSSNDDVFELQVIYVVKDSPADKAGLKRGDFITHIGKEKIDGINAPYLLRGGQREITVQRPINRDSIFKNLSMGKDINYINKFREEHKMILEPSREVDDNPTNFSKVIEYRSKKIGYVVYNHFDSTRKNAKEGHKYDDYMIKTFQDLKSQHIEEIVVDLRYNGGGSTTSAQILASLLAPVKALGKEVAYKLTFNSKNTNKNQDYLFMTGSSQTESNILIANSDLKRVYFLVGSNTASASELVINALKGIDMPVFLIGSQTEGKNTAMAKHESPTEFEDMKLEMWPIVARVSNAKDNTNYGDGFKPDVIIHNNDRFILYPFGDIESPYIKAVLNDIFKRENTSRAGGEEQFSRTKTLWSSLDRKASGLYISE